MGALERVSDMKAKGMTNSAISSILLSEGTSKKEIDSLISQVDIKQAVDETEDIKAPRSLESLGVKKESMEKEYEGMQPSMLTKEENSQDNQEYPPQQYNQPISQEYQQQYPQQGYPQQGYEQYNYSSAVSADTISEISEQIVSEKLLPLKDQIEKAIDFRNSAESRISGIDERVRRIEKIIDRLQLSILQKVGEYVTNVEDIKQELAETQKSFKSLLPQNSRQEKTK